MSARDTLKQRIMRTRLYDVWRAWRVRTTARGAEEAWERAGRPDPPPHAVKERTLREYATRYGLRVLVETGTYYGDMVEAMRRDFDEVYSIELADALYEKAARRFRKTANVTIVHGDSGSRIADVVRELDRPALFWLDGHYSGGETARGDEETPVLAELTHVLGAAERGHVAIVDDARLFGTDPAYPTIDEVRAFVAARRPDLEVSVRDDSIRIAPSA